MAFYRSEIRKPTTAEVGRRPVVANDEASCRFFLENKDIIEKQL